ncbi:MAG: S41 family peptidase [Candidatus Marinimicrobia bacterium]|nr:S41 family peptidase [Candidatus Neomarinimicrobiota bacterium]
MDNRKFYQKWYFRTILFVILSITLVLALSNKEEKDYYKELHNSLNLYNKTFKQLVTSYVDKINPEKLAERSLDEILEGLDPYTTILTRKEKEPVEMLSEGKYGGIGVRITMRNDTVTAIAPMDGGPAIRAGIRPCDQILKVDTIETNGMSLGDVSETIRGKVGTEVKLTIRRPGSEGTIVYELTRAKIDVPKISYSGMLNENVGYVRLTGFSRGAAEKFARTIKELSDENQKFNSLVLDLRSNPGGLLSEALGIAEMFIPSGDTLLFTKGRTKQSNRVIHAKRQPIINPDVKLAVLINGGSASASEIVAGVLQDYDRALVIGQRSFGKGLVQRVHKLDDEHSLKITNAKYYIPSGRCVQKPEFIDNPNLVFSEEEDDTIFYTMNGRKVIGGGGIEPDIKIEEEDFKKYRYSAFLVSKNTFYNFAIKYKTEHDSLPAYSEVDENIIKAFSEYIHSQDLKYEYKNEEKLKKIEEKLSEKEEFKNLDLSFDKIYNVYTKMRREEFDKNEKIIKRRLMAEFATLKGGTKERVKSSLEYDKDVEKALEILADKQDYMSILGYAGN